MLALTRPLSRLQANRSPTNMNQIFPLQQNNTNQCRFIFVSKCLTILFGSIKKYNVSSVFSKAFLFNHFATSDTYMRQLFHCLQWYVGSERVNDVHIHIFIKFIQEWDKQYCEEKNTSIWSRKSIFVFEYRIDFFLTHVVGTMCRFVVIQLLGLYRISGSTRYPAEYLVSSRYPESSIQ